MIPRRGWKWQRRTTRASRLMIFKPFSIAYSELSWWRCWTCHRKSAGKRWNDACALCPSPCQFFHTEGDRRLKQRKAPYLLELLDELAEAVAVRGQLEEARGRLEVLWIE